MNKYLHCNHNKHDDDVNQNKSSRKALSLVFWLNLIFSIIEVVGGVLTNSTAILTDAFHDFMDAMAIGLAVFLEKISDKKRSAKFSYGFKRFSLLSALGLSVFLIIGAVVMIFAVYKSFVNPKEVHSVGMLVLAVLGLTVNGLAFLKIKNTTHGHAHKKHNYNSRSIMLHLLEDVLGWAAVLIGALIIYFTSWYWIDGVLAIGIAIYILFNASRNLIETAKLMLQSVPENVNLDQLKADLMKIESVSNIHDVHVWSMDGNYNVGTVHIAVNNLLVRTKSEIMNDAIQIMKSHNIQHPTVQIESNDNACELENC